MVAATRLDCVLGSSATMRQALVRAVHHTRHRAAFGSPLVDLGGRDDLVDRGQHAVPPAADDLTDAGAALAIAAAASLAFDAAGRLVASPGAM